MLRLFDLCEEMFTLTINITHVYPVDRELMRADEENRKTKRQIDAYVLEREALLRPEEKVTLNLGTVTTVAAQLAQQETVAHDTRQRVPAV